MAKCNRCSLLQSTFAPLSMMITFPSFLVGRIGASAGREMPLIRPIFMIAPDKIAPVLPADTKPTTFSSSFKRSKAFTKEESFFCLIATVGTSSFVMTSSALTISIRSVLPFKISLILSSFPVKTTVKSFLSLTASTAPSTTSKGALSPPKASTTTFIITPKILIYKLTYNITKSRAKSQKNMDEKRKNSTISD